MKWNSIKRKIAFFGVNHLFKGTRFFGVKRGLLRWAGYDIGDGTKIVGPLFATAHFTVGRDCWVGRDLRIEGNGWVHIGDNCDIAPSVMFCTGGHSIGDGNRRAGEGQTYTINVGNGCWICARATVVKNVTIGNGCVVAACACVTEDLPRDAVCAGVPARVIRELDHETA